MKNKLFKIGWLLASVIVTFLIASLVYKYLYGGLVGRYQKANYGIDYLLIFVILVVAFLAMPALKYFEHRKRKQIENELKRQLEESRKNKE